MASDRDTLADLIYRVGCYDNEDAAAAAAALLLAAGVRPPARVIETAEQRDAMPPGSVVLSDSGYAWQRIEWWWQSTDEGVGGAPSLPATILHVPTEEARDGE
ncbi:hypothetical protein GV791_14770 [Nocardia cyriacigeorgica]|uniref:Uncharacterized protein n=1 Tax=Nocardia cyriacigeorgica TaxID=135487 RepID=A0A6P1CMX3_9NOCA|nr:hypothetical protein [Nocardia cyriacigeorgica]NEW33818.1 hypothetical protein [Nocardia cyriacigeorgica]